MMPYKFTFATIVNVNLCLYGCCIYEIGYHALSMKHDKPREDETARAEEKLFELPELMHNLDLLVDMAGQEIVKNDKK